MSFRENLRFLMDTKGLQIKELASIANISENTLKTYLKEDSAEPKLSKAVSLATALNVSVEFLATDSNKIEREKTITQLELLQLVNRMPDNKRNLLLKIGKILENE